MAATAHFRLRARWREIKQGRPGHRFQGRYQRARQKERKAGAGQRILFVVAGLIALAIGVFLVIFPGPAIPFFFLAGAFLATESRPIARFMDWAEVRLRKIGEWGKQRWQRWPAPARIALVVVGACGSAASAYFTFRLMRG